MYEKIMLFFRVGRFPDRKYEVGVVGQNDIIQVNVPTYTYRAVYIIIL